MQPLSQGVDSRQDCHHACLKMCTHACGRCVQAFAERNNVSLVKVQHAVMVTKYLVSLEGEAKPNSSRLGEAQGSGGDIMSTLSTEDEDVGDTMAGVYACLVGLEHVWLHDIACAVIVKRHGGMLHT